ncbi:MAG TPA: hypothetical protein VN457_07460, partial [Chlamydiales bacterium]|nr:hypothetical protein [Chlamydiales bacterium]
VLGKNEQGAWAQEVVDHLFGKANVPRFFDMGVFDVKWPIPLKWSVEWIRSLGGSFCEHDLLAGTTFRAMHARTTYIAFGCLFGALSGYSAGEGSVNKQVRLIHNAHYRAGRITVPAKLFLSCVNNSEENCNGSLQLRVGHQAAPEVDLAVAAA